MTAPQPSPDSVQLTADGTAFSDLDGLSRELLTDILDTADSFIEVVSAHQEGAVAARTYRGESVFRIQHPYPQYFRAGRQTAIRGCANLDISTSATSKGESLSDTLLNPAMASDMFVVRWPRAVRPILLLPA